MKILSRKRKQGSVLVITMVTCVVIGVVLASFLALISSRYKLTVRSMGWNAAIPVLEAGIEEALTHLHKNPKSPSADGWTATTVGGQPVHTKQRYLPDGSYYSVAIYNAISTNPVIYSSGFTPSPLEQNKYISRLVRVNTTNPPSLFVRAITTRQNITLGGNVYIDGFNSAAGPYNITNRLANGGLATLGSVSAGGADVYGSVTTGPVGTITINSGTIGDLDWNKNYSGIQPGATNNDFNTSVSETAPPSGGPFPSPVITSVGSSNIIYLTTGTNQINSISLTKNTDPIIVTGNATLWVLGDLSITGTGAIQIKTNASLTLYVGGTAKLAGGGVVNGTGLASKFTLVGLPTCTSIAYTGTSDFVGGVIAPSADFTISGTPTMIGAVIAKSFTSSGTADFHYDQAMATGTGLVVGGWQEL